MHQYQNVHSVLPPGKKGCCWGTWLVYALPYLEQQTLFNAWNSCGINSPGVPANYDLDLRYFGAANMTVTSTRLEVYLCPSDLTNAPISAALNGVTYACTSQNYAANFGNTTVLQTDFQGIPFRGAPFVDIGSPLGDYNQPAQRNRRLQRDHRRAQQYAASLRGRRRPGTGPPRVLLVGRRGHLRGVLDPQQLIPRRALQPPLLHQPVPEPTVHLRDDGPARDVRRAEPAPRGRQRGHGRRLGPLHQELDQFPDLAGDEHGRGSRIRRRRRPLLMRPSIDRISPTREPDRRPVMRQSWRKLLFLHWPIPSDQLRPLVPPQLDLDLFEGTAYVGLVPFTMTGVRPVGLPPIRGISNFHETNVRTYVHRDGRDPGVWFFSLDAANRLAVYLARTFFHLPYYHARMFLEPEPAARLGRPSSDPLRGRPAPAGPPACLLPHPCHPDRPGPARISPIRSNTSSSSAISSTQSPTTGPTRARSTIAPTLYNPQQSGLSMRPSWPPPGSPGQTTPPGTLRPGSGCQDLCSGEERLTTTSVPNRRQTAREIRTLNRPRDGTASSSCARALPSSIIELPKIAVLRGSVVLQEALGAPPQ